MITLPYKIKGRVRHGKKLGRTIGMPTVNLVPYADAFTQGTAAAASDRDEYFSDGLSRSDFGVYYSEIEFDGKTLCGVTNIGIRPTVTEGREEKPAITVETYIFDFDGDLYDREITVTLLAFRRPEQRFSSVAELSARMHDDMNAGRKFFAAIHSCFKHNQK